MGSLHVDEGEGTAGKIANVKDNAGPSPSIPLPNQGANASSQAKPTHQNIIRLAPPLVITEEEIKTALQIIEEAMKELPNLKGKKQDEILPKGEKDVHIGLED